MTIRNTLVNIIGGRELLRQREAEKSAVKEILNAYEMGRYVITPQMIAERMAHFSEYDQSTLLQMIRNKYASFMPSAYRRMALIGFAWSKGMLDPTAAPSTLTVYVPASTSISSAIEANPRTAARLFSTPDFR